MADFSHIKGDIPSMVDVTDKRITSRKATVVSWSKTNLTFDTRHHRMASLASVHITKFLHHLIPMTHPIPFTHISTQYEHTQIPCERRVMASVRANWYTGMEVEAYLGALTYHVALLREFHPSNFLLIGPTLLLDKSGGKSGHVKRYISVVTSTINGNFLEFKQGDRLAVGKDVNFRTPLPADIPFVYIGGFPFTLEDPGTLVAKSSGIIRVNHRVIGALSGVGELKP